MPVASCTACEARVPGRASFCPGCGGRIGAEDGVMVSVRSRVTPAVSILVLALGAVALSIFMFATGHPIGGLLLLVAALFQFGLSGEAARHRPESGVVSITARATYRVRAAADAFAERVRARLERRRIRRTLDGLRARRAGLLQELGDGVYRGDAEAADAALLSIRGLDEDVAAAEARLRALRSAARRPARVWTAVHVEPDFEAPEPQPAAGLADD